jgi:beta-lactamase regulating signal transducer with metallopeptidase domain
MEYILQLLSDDMIYALGWTVIHSLWQASLIALFMSFLLKKYQNHSSVLRYRLAALSLFTVLVSSLATFIIYYDMGGSQFIVEATGVSAMSGAGSNMATHSFLGGLSNFFEENLGLIVWTWMLGCLLFLLKLLGGLIYVKRLVNSSAPLENISVIERFNSLVKKLRFRKGISLLESARVQTPMMLGHIKPVILFPIGLINKLEIEEVEAILAHEISHVYRNDYLINIIQSLVEVLFYYHPAVWWISANIKSERENCCDDLALQICGNKIKYASALIKLKEIEISSIPSLAIPFSSNNENLFNRIKRIFDQPQNKSNLREKMVMISFLLVSLVLFSFGKKDFSYGVEEEICDDIEVMHNNFTEYDEDEIFEYKIELVSDTLPKKLKKNKITVERDNGEKNIVLKMEDGKVEYLEIDGVEIPKEDYKKHMKEIKALTPLNSKHGLVHSFDFDSDFPVFIYSDSMEYGDQDKLYKFYGDNVIIDLKNKFFNADSLNWHFDGEHHDKAKIYFERAKDLMNKDGNNIFEFSDSLYKLKFKDNAVQFYGLFDDMDSIRSNNFYFDTDSLLTKYRFHIDGNNQWFGDAKDSYLKILKDSSFNRLHVYPDKNIYKDLQPFVYPHRLEKGDYGSGIHIFGRSIQQKILSEMHHDGLIENTDKEYEIELSGKNLKINGKKMPKQIWQKYKKIYEEAQGIELNKKTKIVFKSKLDDHKRLRIRTI